MSTKKTFLTFLNEMRAKAQEQQVQTETIINPTQNVDSTINPATQTTTDPAAEAAAQAAALAAQQAAAAEAAAKAAADAQAAAAVPNATNPTDPTQNPQ